MKLTQEAQNCWQSYLKTVNNPENTRQRFYEAFSIGNTEESKNEGAQLIVQGIKTATSALLWEYEISGVNPPVLGSLSLVEDGQQKPVCIVETTEIKIQPFSMVSTQFAFDYGEWDRTLESWRKNCWDYYIEQCQYFGREVSEEMPLVCERFKVIYRCK